MMDNANQWLTGHIYGAKAPIYDYLSELLYPKLSSNGTSAI
jgi:hypothetical protein